MNFAAPRVDGRNPRGPAVVNAVVPRHDRVGTTTSTVRNGS